MAAFIDTASATQASAGVREMRFEILGPMRVIDGDVVRQVAGVRQRIVLGALLAHANQPVASEQLAEFVWDGAPPLRAVTTLRTYVMRLRGNLGSAASRILTRDPGYLVEVGEDELDALAFEALCQEAGTAIRARAWADASAVSIRALALWRGAPLADVRSQALRDAWIPQLEQHRTLALEWHAEAELHLGHHEQIIPKLQELTARHPLHEHFHAQLILALYRAGRQAEALMAYRHTRRMLVDELGIEPGHELGRLHERILAADADLLKPSSTDESLPPAPVPIPAPSPPPTPTPTPATISAPRHLPTAVRHFIGRRAELDTLSSLLLQAGQTADGGGTVVISAIDGMAGIGKTALAVHAAHRLAERFPDGQLFIDLHGHAQGYEPRAPGEALLWFLRALDVPPQRIPRDVEERAALYRERLADTRTLILLDNAADEAQVRPLLPGSAGCLVLITSRRRLKGLDDAFALSLDVLPQADAITVVRTVAGPERVQASDPLLAEVASLCGHLPLALRIAAALLRHRPAWSTEHLVGLLRDQQRRVSALSDGDRDLGAVFDLSYRNLDERQRMLFRRLGLMPGPDLDAYAAAALTGTDPATSTRLLEDLVDHNLLIQHTPNRYRLHDLLRAHARTMADRDTAPDRETARDRLLDYYQHTANRADARIARRTRPHLAGPAPMHAPHFPDPETARAWLRTERANLLAALQTARDERVIALTSGLASLLRLDGAWTEAIALHVAAASAAERLADTRSQANALIDLGAARRATGDLPGAARNLEAARDLHRDLRDRLGQANALIELGSTRRVSGDQPGAARDLQEALGLYRDLNDRHGQADALTRLGVARELTGDLPGAQRDLQEALNLYQEVGDRSGQADALARLGDVRRVTGDYAAAQRDLQESLNLYQDLGSRRGQADALTFLGDVRRATGDLPGAARDLEAALDLYRDLGERNGHAFVLTLLGAVRRATGDLPGAAQNLQAALSLYRQIRARGNEAWALNHYAAVFADTGDHTRARTLYHEALRLARETQQPDDEALALEGIGECHLQAGDTETGSVQLKQALDIFQRLGLSPDADRVKARLDSPAPRP